MLWSLSRLGSLFYDKAVLLLIHLRIKLNAKFDSNSARNASLWERISCAMKAKGHPFEAHQCEGKMDRLMDEYKTYRENPHETGNNQVTFHYATQMEKLMGDWVNVEPDVTYSFGAMATKTVKTKAPVVPAIYID